MITYGSEVTVRVQELELPVIDAVSVTGVWDCTANVETLTVAELAPWAMTTEPGTDAAVAFELESVTVIGESAARLSCTVITDDAPP